MIANPVCYARYTLGVNDYSIRKEDFNGRAHLIVPVVMMVEGVHNGSQGPLLHTIDELGKFPETWNDIPIMVNHPEIEGRPVSAKKPRLIDSTAVGRVYNTKIDGKKLKAEAWLDELQLKAVSPIAYNYILEKKPLEVSIGVFTDDEMTRGVWNEETYDAIAKNHRPDHLALLPGGKGACSWEDGAGIRVNQDQKGGDVTDLCKIAHELHSKGFTLLSINEEKGYQSILEAIQAKLSSQSDGESGYYVEEVFSDSCVYSVITNGDYSGKVLKRRSYSIDVNGVVSFSGDPETVRRKIEYVPIINANKEVRSMANKKLVSGLIANTITRFTEDDREWLETLSDDQLSKLSPVEPEPVKINKETALKAMAELEVPAEEILSLLPVDMKQKIDLGVKAYEDNRTAMISRILANSKKDLFTAEELGTYSDVVLSKLDSQLSQKQTSDVHDYSAQGTGRHISPAAYGEMLLPPGVEVKGGK